MKEFRIETEYIELAKLLKASGLCATGGQAKIAVTAGHIKVDGQLETRKGRKIRPGQTVEFEGVKILVQAKP